MDESSAEVAGAGAGRRPTEGAEPVARRAAGRVGAWLAAATLFLAATPAPAQDRWTLALSAGLYDVFEARETGEAGVEWRGREMRWRLRPAVGVMVTGEETVVGHVGLRRDLRLADRWRLTPGFAFAFWERGDGKNLGSALEFRSSIELAYQLTDRARLGLALYHLSNAGIDELNPGANSLVVVLQF